MRQGLRNTLVGTLVCALVFLHGCGSEEDSEPTDDEVELDVELTGSVGDGPVVNATLRVISDDGEELSRTSSDQTAGYNVQVKVKGKHYPLTIEAKGGVDLVIDRDPGFTMLGASTEPRNKAVVNVSPVSTLAVTMASLMDGGMSTSTIDTALAIVLAEFDLGLTSELSRDPMTTPIDDSNLAEMVKSSEMMAEVLRRVQATVGAANIDDVIVSLAADLVDGQLNGDGPAHSDRRVAAATIIAAGQVSVEGMRNELVVDGAVATAKLDDVIRRLAARGDVALTGTRTVTWGLIEQALRGVESAYALSGNADLALLHEELSGLTAGMTPTEVRTALTGASSSSFDTSLAQISTSSESDLDAVLLGGEVPTGTPTEPLPPPPNAPPTISGTPQPSVLQDTLYQFQPTASDADGDPLTFSITNRPSWASFDTATGKLEGTPTASDIGSYGGIDISVSDGTDVAALATFSITVQAIEFGSATLSWQPPTENTDGSPLLDLAGYRIYWGTESGYYTESAQIDNPGITTYVVENLPPGTYYFVTTAVNELLVESAFSNEAFKTIQ